MSPSIMKILTCVAACVSITALFTFAYGRNLPYLPDPNAEDLARRDFSANLTGHHGAWREPGPKPIDDETWDKLICKGENLVRMMSKNDKDAGALFTPEQESAASQWKTFPGLFNEWGYLWEVNEARTDFIGYGIEDMCKDIGVSAKEEDWVEYKVNHGDIFKNLDKQTYELHGKTWRVTGAYYTFGINIKDGVLVSRDAFSPGSQGKLRNPPVTELPGLKKNSDIMWGAWDTALGKANIRFILRWGIINAVTQRTVKRALMTLGDDTKLLEWSGRVSFTMDTAVGKALLGTPNGIAAAYMLIQRKAELHNKKITKVDVFRQSCPWGYMKCEQKRMGNPSDKRPPVKPTPML